MKIALGSEISLEMNYEKFQDRRVLVTGHTGFKGTWLSLWLDRLGAKVSGFSLKPETEPNLFHSTGVESCLENHILADVREASDLRRALDDCEPELIFHLAAQPLVRRSYREPVATLETNFNGTLNLLEGLRDRGQPCSVIVITTDKVYKNEERPVGYKESDALGGADPYSASKAAAELVVQCYRESYFAGGDVKLASARGGNVIGGGDWAPDRIVTDLLLALEKNEVLELRNPNAVRPWQHVLDLLNGYLSLALKLMGPDADNYCEAWNFGPLSGDDVRVSELAQEFIEVWGSGQWSDASHPEQLHETKLLRLSIDKSITKLDWRPCWSAKEAIARTAKWYRAQRAGQSMREYCLNQISEYEGLVRS